MYNTLNVILMCVKKKNKPDDRNGAVWYPDAARYVRVASFGESRGEAAPRVFAELTRTTGCRSVRPRAEALRMAAVPGDVGDTAAPHGK